MRESSAQFKLVLQDGYVLRFDASEFPFRGRSDPQASIEVKRGRAWARYGTDQPEKVSSEAIHATFGRLGTVRVRFDQRSKKVDVSSCNRAISRTGVFRGRIEFKGENGYVSVETNRAKGTTFEYVRRDRCSRDRRPGGRRGAAAIGLRADPVKATLLSCGPTDGLGFASFVAPRQDRAFHLAASVEGDRRLFVVRFVLAGGDSDAFSFRPDLAQASIRPPRPFAGAAEYADGRLAGDLAVDFPGAENVALTVGAAELLRGFGHSFPDCFPISNDRMGGDARGPSLAQPR